MDLPAKTYKAWRGPLSLKSRLRDAARTAAIRCLSLTSRVNPGGEWIWFPYYHHVFDDERAGFARHLRHLRNFGDFLSLDRAVELLARGGPIGGRYFCVTFDDGFKNCRTNALPILVEHACPATVYVPTAAMDGQYADGNEKSGGGKSEYMDWDDCRALLRAGMLIGSHTVHHVRLETASDAVVKDELRLSKQKIESELGIECRHFASPWGGAGTPSQIEIVKRLGYHSFATTERGANRQAADPFHLRRDHALANWGEFQLKYFLSRACE